ncbi:high mobility group box domain-containing protein [Irpex rosettiformis]|uniref:High mobility group box domain-containing protein n=1 Tax=Irpex rosettiformis TaxID=378272 RepID=A0ACB8UE32_9APHY|nr:high mobility group box domain-containing protein [Irpex rosettiformis]
MLNSNSKKCRQLIGSLGAVAETMRNCATIAEQFAQLISPIPYHPALALPNGPIQHMQPPPSIETPGVKRKREAEEKKKRKTKPRDPNAPKRPPSSYLLFQNEVRQQLKAKHPDVPNNELLNLIAKAWGEMPKEEKDEYESRQKVAKDVYLAEKAAYETSQKGDGSVVPTLPAVVPVLPPVSVPVPTEEMKVPSEPAVTSTDESSDDEQQSGTSSDSDEEEEEAPQPATKKAKQPSSAAATAVKQAAKKEKKSKKSSA